MELVRLLAQVRYEMIQGTNRTEVGKVTNNTEDVRPGDVYVCVRGHETDGHLFAGEAAARGAAAIVTERREIRPRGVAVAAVPDARWALAAMSAASCGYPADRLFLIGITGTKGKTTTAWMVREVLRSAGVRTGMIGTIETDTGRRRFSSSHTTPESCRIQEYLKEMAEAGCTAAVMEVSSQALKLQRTAGICFQSAVFTNLGEDHISPAEHGSLEEYRQCKHLLFTQCETGIGNADDPFYGEMFARTECRKVTFGIRNRADFQATRAGRAEAEKAGLRFWLKGDGTPLYVPLPGIFNVYNALAATAVLSEMGIPMSRIREGLARIEIPGRMEQILLPDAGVVFLDYAHNGMSLAGALRTLKDYVEDRKKRFPQARLVAVFGCGGNRARERRYDMGEAAGRLADYTVLTSDNPRTEPPGEILRDIEEGMLRTSGLYEVVEDRRTAIRQVIRSRMPGDVILIAGKGHETCQEIGGLRIHMDDREIIEQSISR